MGYGYGYGMHRPVPVFHTERNVYALLARQQCAATYHEYLATKSRGIFSPQQHGLPCRHLACSRRRAWGRERKTIARKFVRQIKPTVLTLPGCLVADRWLSHTEKVPGTTPAGGLRYVRAPLAAAQRPSPPHRQEGHRRRDKWAL